MAIFIPEEKVADIRNTADIVDVISEAVLLKKAGKNYVGLCPFHSEKTPSFTVSPEKQIFYCFGCGAGGNVFSFLMKQNGLSFPETARMLAKRYGIEIPTQTMSQKQKERINEREKLRDINKQAMNFFCYTLIKSSAGKKAILYLNERGIKKETIDGFNLGYAPRDWDSLVRFFSKQGISLRLVEKSGLIISRKDKSGYYDRFRGRIIFPIFNTINQVIGFGGRVMDDSLPKYLNSPETPVYNKKRSLYGLNRAKGKCRENNTVYVVEGYFDLLSLHQNGIENSVAILGTALSSEHTSLLRGYSSRIVLVYDSDEAGIKAALKSIGRFVKEEVDARVIILPSGYDPDSYLFEFGPEHFMNASKQALGIFPFLIESAVKKHGLSIDGKIRIVSELKEPLASINDSVVRSLYIKELAERIDIDEAAVLEKVREVSDKRGANYQYLADGGHPQRKYDRLERRIIAMMLQFPGILSEISKRNVLDYFENNSLKSVGQIILQHNEKSGGQVSEIIELIDDKDKRSIAASLAIGEDLWDREGCFKLITQFENSRSRNKNALLKKIKAAEEDNDHEMLLKLLKEKQIQARSKKKREHF